MGHNGFRLKCQNYRPPFITIVARRAGSNESSSWPNCHGWSFEQTSSCLSGSTQLYKGFRVLIPKQHILFYSFGLVFPGTHCSILRIVEQKAETVLLFILPSLVSAAGGGLLLGCIEIALCLPLSLISSKLCFLIQNFFCCRSCFVSSCVCAAHTYKIFEHIALYFEIIFI
jgi:hypothetical protein